MELFMDREKHLSMIHGEISKMGRNVLICRGLCLGVLTWVLFLAAQHGDRLLSIFSCVPIFGLWLMDTYFLRQERLFRKLYDHVRKETTKVDFSMDTLPFKKLVPSYMKTMFSKPARLIYISVLGFIIWLQYFLRVVL